MASLRKNVAGQNFTLVLINASTGAALTGATVTVEVTKDNGSQTSGGGTVTEKGNGQYNYAPTQAETNATDVGFLFSATGAIPVNYDFHPDVVDGNGYLSVNMVDIAGSAVSTTAAQIGANIVAISGTGSAGTPGYVGIDLSAVHAPTASLNLSGTTIAFSDGVGSVTGSVGSVTGAVGSVTGNVGGSVTGSVGSVLGNVYGSVSSVTGSVGSVTGNVGGSVTGSVGSVLGNVGGSVASVAGNVSGSVTGSVGSVLGNVDGDVVGSVGSIIAAVQVGSYANNEDPATLVLGATASSWDGAGTIGQKINAAGSATDPWATALPGSYSAGQAGYIVGHNLDAQVSTRSTYAGGPVASVTGNVGGSVLGSVASVAGNVGGSVTGSVGSVVAAIEVGSYASGQDPATLILAAMIETGVSMLQAQRYVLAAAAGVVTGAQTGSFTISAGGNPSTTRIAGTGDEYGDRSSITLTG